MRRPGERREPLPFQPPATAFVHRAAALGLSVPCAVEISLEFDLAKRDLTSIGRAGALERLVDEAQDARIGSAVAPPYAGYLRALSTMGPRQPEPLEVEEPLDAPLRLFPRVLAVDPVEALTPERLQQALVLERAAVAASRTMVEYVLFWAASL